MIRLLLTLLALHAAGSWATGLDELTAADKLRLRAWVTPEDNIVVGQEVRMIIEISTPRWFAGGTRITLPDVDNVVVLRRNEFATNLSRREGDTTWVVQQWQLELYAQRPGRFLVPPVALELAVNDADAGIVRGSMATETLSFSAAVPAALQGVESWLAAPSFTIEQRFDRQLEGLKPGDAFKRTVELRATNLTAMMLPEVLVQSIDGLPAYPEIPELEDRSNRGEATAIRRESIAYLVERSGQFQLPEQRFYWWNTASGRVETTILPAVEIDAGAAVASTTSLPKLPALVTKRELLQIAGAVLVLGLITLLWRRLRSGRRQLLRQAQRAMQQGDQAKAAALLYRWLNTRPAEADWLSLRNTANAAGGESLGGDIEQLLRAAYADTRGEDGRQLKNALRRLRTRTRRHQPATSGGLNPTQPR